MRPPKDNVVLPEIGEVVRREDGVGHSLARMIFRGPLLSVYVPLSQEKNG